MKPSACLPPVTELRSPASFFPVLTLLLLASDLPKVLDGLAKLSVEVEH
jgi:hypothetical protein